MKKYEKRFDKRDWDELRPITAKVGVIKNADGSAYFKIGDTAAYAAVYGPRELYPKFLQNPKKGILRCNYNMMPFSGAGDRVRPGSSRRSKDISLVTVKSLISVLDLRDFPNAVVDVFIELPETDAGSRCAGICAASMALADAGVPMKDMVAAVALGKVGDKIVVDLNGEEEHFENNATTDIALAMIQRSQKIALMQMDGEISKEDLHKALEMSKSAFKRIFEIQNKALKDKYNTHPEDNEKESKKKADSKKK